MAGHATAAGYKTRLAALGVNTADAGFLADLADEVAWVKKVAAAQQVEP
jgi:hypothetical protein